MEENNIYLQTYSNFDDYQTSSKIEIGVESFLIYCVYKYSAPVKVKLKFVFLPCSSKNTEVKITLDVSNEELCYIDEKQIPWRVSSCVLPVVIHEDTVITGMCAVARHICKYRSLPQAAAEHEEGLLGFRKSCLQAPNEVSIWTKFCEVDIIKSVQDILSAQQLDEIPLNLVRFENHLHKPVRIHNVYKVAQDLKKLSLNSDEKNEIIKDS